MEFTTVGRASRICGTGPAPELVLTKGPCRCIVAG